MSGSVADREGGLRLIVPALMLVLPAILLIAALLSLAPPPPDPTLPAAEELVAAREPVDDLAIVVATPATEQSTLASEIAVATPGLPTAVPTAQATPTPQASWVGPSTFTFVALGVDQRNDTEIPRTDTIMIGKVDLRTPRVNLVSIPRDLLVEVPGYGQDRINSAYVYGEQFKEPGGGIGLLKRTIEKSFGLQIDHFGLIDFQCFRTAVDAMGGVTVNVPRSIVDPNYPTEDYGTKVVRFETGVQRLDGARALEYARTRYADSDFHRMQRQQLIIAAMREQLVQLRTLPSLPSMIGGCRNMRSDLGWREYFALATTMQSLNGGRVSFAAIDERMTVDTMISSGAAVLLPRWGSIRALLTETFGPAAIAPSSTAGSAALPAATPPASPSPFPLPFPRDDWVARPSPFDVPPDDPSFVAPPLAQPSHRT